MMTATLDEAGAERPRVLLVAEAANPEWVSVPLIGWHCARALARVADAHLVTQVRNREAILRAGLVEGRDFTAIDTEAVVGPIWRLGQRLRGGTGKGWTTVQAVAALTYPYFERRVWRAFGPRLMAGEFQVVHRITPVSPTCPSPLARRCRRAGVPFVVGPLNGGLPWPSGFDRVRRREREWLSYARSLHRLLPGHRSTWRDAAAILVGSSATWDEVARGHAEKSFYVPENSIDPARFPRRRHRRATRPVRCVFVGRLVPYKGADMLLEAAAPLLRDGSLHLEIIGDGPEMPALRALADRERIGEGVAFRGWVEHGRLIDHLVEADLLTFPSIREFGGGVVLEAMAVGLVPVVVAYGGPAELATEETGYLVPLGDRAAIVARLRETLAGIVADPSQIEPRSEAALRRIGRHFTWEAKADQILDVYRWLLARRPGAPAPSLKPPGLAPAMPAALARS
jgi:glycosyltransferase involved in cell wall biosynthesis